MRLFRIVAKQELYLDMEMKQLLRKLGFVWTSVSRHPALPHTHKKKNIMNAEVGVAGAEDERTLVETRVELPSLVAHSQPQSPLARGAKVAEGRQFPSLHVCQNKLCIISICR